MANRSVGNRRRGCGEARRKKPSASGSRTLGAGAGQVCDASSVGTFAWRIPQIIVSDVVADVPSTLNAELRDYQIEGFRRH